MQFFATIHSISRMKNDVHAWFMSFNGQTRNGVRLTVKPEFKKKAYLGEYRFANGWGINTRWDLDCHKDAQHYKPYDDIADVQSVVDEGFEYVLKCKRI